MPGKHVFICAAPEDRGYYQELTAALDAWQAPHTELGDIPEPLTALPAQVEQAIRDCGVFLRVCSTHTRASSAVNLATAAFQRLLAKEKRRRGDQRRSLINLIIDPAYQLDENEQKLLYITTQGKARALWLEELAAPVGVATLTQRVSRRALLGMGVGGAVALASAGGAGYLLYERHLTQVQSQALEITAKISGNPAKTFKLSDIPADDFSHPQVLLADGVVYAQPSLSQYSDKRDNSVYILSVPKGTAQRITIPTSHDIPQGVLVAATSDMFLLYSEQLTVYASGVNAPNPTRLWAYRRDGKLLWTINCDFAGNPVISNGVIYSMAGYEASRTADSVSTNVYFDAYSVNDGRRLWRNADVDLNGFLITPAIAGGRVFVGSVDHKLYCLDAATGKTQWTYLTRGPVLGAPVSDGSTVYFGSNDNSVYALNAVTGRLRWRFTTGGAVTAPPLLYDGVAYVGSADAYLYALNARTGSFYWRIYVGSNFQIDDQQLYQVQNSLAVYRNVIFVSVYGGLFAVDLRDGSERWNKVPVAPDVNTLSAPIVSDGLALVGAADNTIYAFNP